MSISLHPEHLKRYKDIAGLLIKYGRSDLVRMAEPDSELLEISRNGNSSPSRTDPPATELANDLETMGPTFVKLGQLLSTRADLLPEAYIDALSRLQDSVEPFPFQQVVETLTAELGESAPVQLT